MLAQRLQAAQSVGGTLQWQHDHEARTFAWLSGGSARFDGLDGEGSVDERFLRFVHAADRARVSTRSPAVARGRSNIASPVPSGEVIEVVQETVELREPSTGRLVTLGTIEDVTAERGRRRTLDQLAHYDAATGLPNRAHVCTYLQATLEAARRRSASVAVISFGVDAFRRIEEVRAQRERGGDLRARGAGAGVALGRSARSSRMRRPRRAARPHELLVVLGEASAEDAAAFFGRVSARLIEPIAVAGTPIVVTCSVGVAVAASGAPMAEAEAMLAHADAALHAAMTEGRGRVVVHAQKMRETLDRKRVVEQRLRESLASGVGLELHYQPKVDARSRRVEAVEALLRSSADPRGPIIPLELVSVAEECGLVHGLGDFVLRTACEQAQRWARNESRACRSTP